MGKYDEYIAGRKRYLNSLDVEQLTKWLSVAKTDDDIKEWSYEEKLSVFTKEEIKAVLDVKMNKMEMYAIYSGDNPMLDKFYTERNEKLDGIDILQKDGWLMPDGSTGDVLIATFYDRDMMMQFNAFLEERDV